MREESRERSEQAADAPADGRRPLPSAADGAILARAPEAPGDAARPAKPRHQQPELPDFWDHRFAGGTTPWDAGGVPADLIRFIERQGLARHTGAPARSVLIPGCGSAWEAAWLDQCGQSVTAVDFSPAAIAAARQALAATAPAFTGQLVCADFFNYAPDAPPDWIYERAFLCALPRRLWPQYAPRMAELLRPGAVLAGFFFIADAPKGPPFGLAPGQLDDLLGPYFECVEQHPVAPGDSIAAFAAGEHWQVWRRR